MRVPSPSMVVALAALFVALGGVGVAATGGNFILGQSNSADKTTALGVSTLPSATTCPAPCPALRVSDTSTAANAGGLQVTNKSTSPAAQLTNNGGGQALKLFVSGGVAPFTVNSGGKVTNLNADKLDGIDSSGFLRNLVPLSLVGATSTDGVITGTNTGSGNGVQGETAGGGASGVYGQNDGAGYGVAGRANAPGGVGVYAESTGGGPALQIHTAGAPPMSVDSSAKVANLNADKVDGASILSNRIISTTHNDHILQLPGFGDFNVSSCDHTNAAFEWSSGGPVAYVIWGDMFNPGDTFNGVANIVFSFSRPRHFATIQLARDTGANTSIATVTVTTNAADCVFAAQAVVQPG